MTSKRDQGVVRVALHEIERLLERSRVAGAAREGWVADMAAELRALMPELEPEAAATIARRMMSEPRRSMDAQSRLDLASLIALKQ